jgi:hypothetical protein
MPPLPPLRLQQQAIWQEPAGPAGAATAAQPAGEAAGLFAATDSLVDALNTAAHILRRCSQDAGDAVTTPG